MSTRAQVQILSQYDDTSVFLYQHYDGDELYDTVKKSIARSRPRWNDEEYLARIIFSDMIKDSLTDLEGFGISTSKHGDIEYLIVVNTLTRDVTKYYIADEDDCIIIRSELFNDIWEQSLLADAKLNEKQTIGIA
jgi:hypothetical protein